MAGKRHWVSGLAGILAAVLLVSLTGGSLSCRVSAAASSSEIQKQLDALKGQKSELDDQIKLLESQISDNQNEIEAIVAKKNVIDQEVSLLHGQILNINEQISAYNLLIADKQTELDNAQAHLSDLNAQYKSRIRAMEEGGKLSYWAVLFRAGSFSDFLDRMNMIKEIAVADNRRLGELRAAANVVAVAKDELQAQKADSERTRAELNAAQMELEAKRMASDELLVQLQEKGAEFEQLVEEAEAEEAKLLLELAQKDKELKSAQYQEWLATSKPTAATKPSGSSGSGDSTGSKDVGGITWIVPTKYIMVTSVFGPRPAPTAGASTCHNGVDLAAPAGTAVVAVRSGQVTDAGHNEFNGYYVKIWHGDEYSSVYLHLTRYTVSKGDYVGAGQLIGYVGSTGISTGPHLHFGISKNGTYVNPANYINI